MTNSLGYDDLLRENSAMLERLKTRHDISGSRTIEIQASFKDRQTALEARASIKAAHEIPKGVILVVSRIAQQDGSQTVDLQFDLQAVPTAGLITKYEAMLKEAAAKFAGGGTSWMIHP